MCRPLITPDNCWHKTTWPEFQPSLPPGLQPVTTRGTGTGEAEARSGVTADRWTRPVGHRCHSAGQREAPHRSVSVALAPSMSGEVQDTPRGSEGLASLPPDTLPWLRKAGAKANSCNQEQGIGAGPAVHDAWESGEQNAVGPTAAPARGEGVPCWTAPGGRAAGGSSDPLRGRAAGAVRRRGPASAQRVGFE